VFDKYVYKVLVFILVFQFKGEQTRICKKLSYYVNFNHSCYLRNYKEENERERNKVCYGSVQPLLLTK
jgi:hypothetical protein